MQIYDRRDVLRQRRGQPVGDELPVALHEHIGQHALEDNHRRDDDQRRAGVEPLREDQDDAPPEPAQNRAEALDRTGEGNAQRAGPAEGLGAVPPRWRPGLPPDAANGWAFFLAHSPFRINRRRSSRHPAASWMRAEKADPIFLVLSSDRPAADSRRPAPSGDAADWPDRARSCGADG